MAAIRRPKRKSRSWGTLLVLALLRASGPVPGGAFLIHFTTTWLLVWFVVNGPIRVLLPRWRFRGGRFL